MEKNIGRAERARQKLHAQRQEEQQIALGKLSTQKAQADEVERRRARDIPKVVTATARTLTALESAGFPGVSAVEIVEVHYSWLSGKDKRKVREEPGWALANSYNEYVEDQGGGSSQVWLLAEGTYYVATSFTGSSGRGTAHNHYLLSPEQYAQTYGGDILPALERLEALSIDGMQG